MRRLTSEQARAMAAMRTKANAGRHGGRYPSSHKPEGPCDCNGCKRREIYRLQAEEKRLAAFTPEYNRLKESISEYKEKIRQLDKSFDFGS